jgi:hypothetical protein
MQFRAGGRKFSKGPRGKTADEPKGLRAVKNKKEKTEKTEKKTSQCTYVLYSALNWLRRACDVVIFLSRF